MKTEVSEIADKIYRLSTFVPQIGPNGSHLQPVPDRCRRAVAVPLRPAPLFPLVSEAVKRVIPLDRLRWTTCSHVEADESGALNRMAGRSAQRHAGARPGRLQHLADRHGRPAAACAQERRGAGPRRQEGALDRHAARAAQLGRRRDLRGDHRHAVQQRPLHPVRPRPSRRPSGDIVEPAIATEKAVPFMPATPQADADPAPAGGVEASTIALMHGPHLQGDGEAALKALADHHAKRLHS